MSTALSDAGVTFADGSVQLAAALPQILSLPNPTLAASAMTLPAATLSLAFRSATASDGTVNATVTGAIAALVIPSTATLGTVSAVASSIVEVVMNNAGTLERAVVNLAGGNDLSERGVISTTAISAGSISANVFYSNTARSNLSYRVVRQIDSTQATAGAWVTSPSLVQGVGGQALTAMSSFGYGQTWQNVSASRVAGTTYYNTTGKPIAVNISTSLSASGTALLTIAGVAVQGSSNAAGGINHVDAIIPLGASYVFTCAGVSSFVWSELR